MTEFEKKFNELRHQWKEDTKYLSDPDKMSEHPAYQEIIKMGPDVVPLMLKELEYKEEFWFGALMTLTGENPVPYSHRGYVRLMCDDWVKWGKAKKLI